MRIRLQYVFLAIIFAAGMAADLHAADSSAPSSRYMGGPAQLVTAPNGAIANKEVLERLPKTAWTEGPEIEQSVEGVWVRIDPAKSGETDKVIRLEFTDGEKPVVGLHVRRAVAEFLPDPDEHYRDADLTIALSGEAWTGLYLSQTTIADLVGSGAAEIRKGSLEEAIALFDLFDRYQPEKADLIMRIYVPDLAKLKSWIAPKAEKLAGE